MNRAINNIDPVFIGGVERSGTSLLYALLASHPNLAMTRRTNFWPYFYERYDDLSQGENLERILGVMKRYRRTIELDLDYEKLKYDFCQGETTYARLFALIWSQFAEKTGKPRWGDKSLNTERYADTIFLNYPNAKIIHIIRDPRDRYASALKRWKVIRGGPGSGTAMWLSSVILARRNLERYPDRYKVVRYESLTADPEGTLQRICEFIGEMYTPEMLLMKGAERFRDEGGNSSFEPHEIGKISPVSVGRFRKTLSQRVIAFMQFMAGKEMAAHGYPLDNISLPLKERLLFLLVDLPLNLARGGTWFGREAYLDYRGRPIPSSRLVS